MLPNDENGDEKKARYLHGIWDVQKERASTEQRDRVGLLFLRYVFRLDGDTIQDFVRGDANAYRLVKDTRPRLYETPVREFWEEVGKVFPEYTREDISWLSKDGYVAAEMFIAELGLDYESPVLQKILNNLLDRRQ